MSEPCDIKARALAFQVKWRGETSERAEAKSFWDDFFQVFGVSRRRLASFEKRTKKLNDRHGYIDLFWPGVLLVEHKSAGKDLSLAYDQAIDYFAGIPDNELPKYVLVSDFQRFVLHDLDAQTQHGFSLDELHENAHLFSFMSGPKTKPVQEVPVTAMAAERLGRLHDLMKESGYEGHALEAYLVRLVFCLFAEDTGIFNKHQLMHLIESKTAEDGSDLGDRMAALFQVLNTPESKRLRGMDRALLEFPYVNGGLFAEPLPVAAFTAAMRASLLECCRLHWGGISPVIFGSLFQAVMDKDARRAVGAHYTSEAIIHRVIDPLVMDDLRQELTQCGKSKAKLLAFQQKLSRITFLDPACGCGNFLVVTYMALRALELEVLKILYAGETFVDIGHVVSVSVEQMHGIEIEDSAAEIARTALWIADHVANIEVSKHFGIYFSRIPLTASPKIVRGNALREPWPCVDYIIGNPPFVGSSYRSQGQKEDMAAIVRPLGLPMSLDFVACWFVRAAQTDSECAFVSTNSICQGEQVNGLWKWVLGQGVYINFAHKSFVWTSEARGKANVHCVVVGFSKREREKKLLFSEGRQEVAKISPYLTSGPTVFLPSREKPICDVPVAGLGCTPNDGGHYLFSEEEYREFILKEPRSAPWFRPWYGADELLHGYHRWVLFLRDCPPEELAAMLMVMSRVKAVKEQRLKSTSQSTRILASTPIKFAREVIVDGPCLVMPKVSSERRQYLPGATLDSVMLSDKAVFIAYYHQYHFGVLSSLMHSAWMRVTCGRMKSDYSYSIGTVYNNYPWPIAPTPAQVQAVEAAAQRVLDTRAEFPGATLANLYDPETMPPTLLKAHQELDRAVDRAYWFKGGDEDARVGFLFELYERVVYGCGLTG